MDLPLLKPKTVLDLTLMREDMTSIEEPESTNTCTRKKRESSTRTSTAQKRKNNHFLGLLFSIGTGFFFTVTSICTKRLKHISSSQLATHCCLAMMLFNLPIIFYKKITFLYPLKTNMYLVLRGIFTAVSFNFIYLSIMYIPLADLSVLASCSPIFTTLFARIFLKEPCGIFHGVGLTLTVVGMILVSKVPLLITTRTVHYDVTYFLGVTFSIIGALGFAMADIIVRLPSMITIHYSISVFYMGTFSVAVSAIVTYFIFGFTLPNCGIDRFYIVLQAVVGGLVEALSTLAMQYEEASVAIMAMTTTNIVVTFLWQTLVDKITPDVYTSAGAVLVMVCIVMIAFRGRLNFLFMKIVDRLKPADNLNR